MNKKPLLQKANFATAPSLLSAVPNAVKIGAGVGGGLGLLQGSGVLESDAEKKATNVGNRLGKVLTSTTVGAGLGAGAGYAVNRYNLSKAPERELQRREAVVAEHEAANPRGIRKAVKRVNKEVEAVKNKVQEVVAPNLDQREARMAEELKRQSTQPEPTPLIDQAISWERNIAAKTQEKVGGLLDRLKGKGNSTRREAGGGIPPNTVNVNSTTDLSKMIRKSANFQDPATIQRLIQHGSTYIPQDNTGVVSLESTLRGKMQKKKLREPKVPASMGVKEINSMIESGKPVGKYFNKEIRKSASFEISPVQIAAGVGGLAGLVGGGLLGRKLAGKPIPLDSDLETKYNNLYQQILTNPERKDLQEEYDRMTYELAETPTAKRNAKRAFYPVAGMIGGRLAGAGLGAVAGAMYENSQYSNKIRKSANFLKRQQQAEFGIGDQINNALTSAGKLITQPVAKAVRKAATKIPAGDRFLGGIPIIGSRLDGGAKAAAAGTYDALQGAAKVLDSDKAAKLTAIGVGGTALAGGGLLAAKLAQKKQENEARYSKSIRKSASFGIIPTGLVNGAQKVARGAANRFGNLSPQINAANVGTAVGAGLGALEGSGINETEEQRRSTGLVGRAGKVLGMTGLGAGVGRGVGSVAGAGVNRYQANQRLQSRRKDNPDAFKNPNTVPRSIEIE
jgi:hypothetical protein